MKNAAILSFLLVLALICSTVSASAQQAQTVSATAQQAQAKKYIAFRDDDVSPGASLDALKAVNQVHIDENVPVTLGIIPHPRESEEGNQLLQDEQFLAYMRSIAPNPLFEFAQHGYSHTSQNLSSPSEFKGRPYEDQYNRILKGQTDLEEAFGMTIRTFIPPFNSGDHNTSEAAAALGFNDYSAFSMGSSKHVYADGMRIEGGFELGAVNETAFNTSIQNAKNITEHFLTTRQSDDTLTVTYHFWAFLDGDGAVDNNKIQQLRDFIDFLKAKGVLFTRLDRHDRSTASETALAVSLSPGAELPVLTIAKSTPQTILTIAKSTPPTFVLVGSMGVVLFTIYFSAQRQGVPRKKPKNK